MKSLGLIALAGTSMLAFAAPAVAQDAATTASAGSGNDVIIVSARRRDEDVQDVPAVVNAVSPEDIENLNLRQFQDITSVVPGLTLQANPSGIGQVSTVRGVDFNVVVSGNNGTIDFYLNDGPLSASILFQSMFDLGQIEVLRGPQGTLRGRASPSGAINVSTRRPDLSEFGGRAEFTGTSREALNANAAINVPIIRDVLAVRLAGIVTEDDGNEVSAVSNSSDLRNESTGFRASIAADPFDGVLLLDGMYQEFHRDATQYGQVESVNQVLTGAAASPITIRATDRLAIAGFAQDIEQDFEVFTWKAQLALAGQRLIYNGLDLSQAFYSFDPTDDAGLFSNDTVNNVPFAQITNTVSASTSHEIRLQNDDRIAGLFDYVIGYLNNKSAANSALSRPTGIGVIGHPVVGNLLANIAVTAIGRPGSNEENSFFGNLTVHPFEGLELSGGLRQINYKNTAGLSIGGVVNPAFAQNEDLDATIYTGSIKYQVNDDVMVYAATGSSWRPGAIVITTTLPAPTAAQRVFLFTDAERSKNYEIGIRSDLMDRRLRLNLTAYQQDFTDYPYRAPGVGVATIAFNGANQSLSFQNFVTGVPVRVRGLEFEFEANLLDNLTFGGVLAYADGKIAGGTIPCVDINGDGVADTSTPTLAQLQAATGADGIDSCTSNDRSSIAAPLSGSLYGEYNMGLTNSMDGFLRGLLSWKGNSQNDPVNPVDDVDAYGLLNLYAGVRDDDGGWELSFFAKNVTDTFRVIERTNGPLSTELRGGIPLGAFLGTSSGTASGTYYGINTTAPREFGVNLRIAFGSR